MTGRSCENNQSYNRMQKIFILLFLVLVLGVQTVVGQSVSQEQMQELIQKYKQQGIGASNLTDAQIRRLTDEMLNKGYSMTQILNMAQENGASVDQLKSIESRVNASSSMKAKIKLNEKKQKAMLKDNAVSNDKVSLKGVFSSNAVDSLIFGFRLFNNEQLSFEPSSNAPVPEGYILGPGDMIKIDIAGLSQQTYELEVGSNGIINIPIVGAVNVLGEEYRNARTLITKRLKSIYTDLGDKTTATITIGRLRTIKVNVMGEVNCPGTYTVSGAASLFNVLYLSGGPNSNGSFRSVQVIRKGKIVATLDVYDFLLNGNSMVNIPLFDSDIVMIPTYQKRVFMDGSFKRPGYYEAIEGENVADIIAYAGGFGTKANQKHIELYRVGDKGYEFKEVKEPEKTLVANGDRIVVKDINTMRLDNAVSIEGAVFTPGRFEYSEGLKLSELLEKAGGLTENVFLSRGVITRLKDDYTLESLNFNVAELASGKYDVNLKAGDEVLISSIDEMRKMPVLTIKGEVRYPGTFDFRENITLGDVILLAGGFTENASPSNVEIVRRLTLEESDTSSVLSARGEYVTITKDLSLDKEGNSYKLEPFDVITIRRVPSAEFKGTVTIRGEVLFAGTYELTSKNDNISTLIERAGGLTPVAYLKGAKLYRKTEVTGKDAKLRLRQTRVLQVDTIDFVPEVGFYELVSLDMEDILSGDVECEDVFLQDGDELVIPAQLQTVKVSGQVLNPVSFKWVKPESAKKYVKRSGGFSPLAKKGKTFVMYPDGKALSTSNFLFFRKYPKVMPGCEVVVPKKPERNPMSVMQWVSVGSSLTTMAALIVSLIK